MALPPYRTTPDLVRGIIETEVGVDLTPFIATANQLTTDVCGKSIPSNPSYTDGYVGSKMELIERWLSAHFYTMFDNQLSRAKAGTVAVGYQYKVDFGLKNSMYGQQAMMLDTDLNLAALENTAQTKRKITLRVSWLGTQRRWELSWPFLIGGPDITTEA